MASQGPLSPGTLASVSGGTGGNTWNNPGNAASSNNSYADVTQDGTGNASDILRATNFGFTIPAGSTIDGIAMEYEILVDDSSGVVMVDFSVKIRGFPGGATAVEHATPQQLTGAEAYYRYPASGNTDKWITGGTWTATQINNSAFGVDFQVNDDGVKPGDVFVDHVRVTVYYTLPPQPAGIMLRMY